MSESKEITEKTLYSILLRETENDSVQEVNPELYTSISEFKKEALAAEITALAAGAGPPANKMAIRLKLCLVLGGGFNVFAICCVAAN